MHWKNWTWLGGSVLPLLMSLIRFAWLWPWLGLIGQFLAPSFGRELLPPWLLVVLPLTAYLLATRAAVPQPVTAVGAGPQVPDASPTVAIGWGARLLVAASGLIFIVLALWWHYYRAAFGLADGAWLRSLGDALIHWGTQEIPPQVVTIVILVWLWLIGVGDVVRQLSHDDVWSAMAGGITALVLYLLVMYMADRPLTPQLFYLVVLLFGAGMLALALSSLKITLGLDRALGLGQRRTSSSPVINRYWLTSTLVTVFGLLGLGLVVTALIAPEQLTALLDAANVVLAWIGQLLSMLLVALSYVFFVIAYFIVRLLEPLLRRLAERFQDMPPLGLPQPPEAQPLQEAAQQAAALSDSYRWLGLAAVVIVLLIIFALALRRLRATAATDEDETRESILSADLLQQQLANLWRRWFGRGRGAADPFLSLAEESDARRRIRALYQQLLTNGAALGAARTPAETPQEYAQHLQATQAAQAAALSALTAGYHQARYAADGPTAAQISAAEEAWRALEEVLQPTSPPPNDGKTTDS